MRKDTTRGEWSWYSEDIPQEERCNTLNAQTVHMSHAHLGSLVYQDYRKSMTG